MKNLTQKGMTLLEVLVAMAIFGTLMAVMMSMMAQDHDTIRNSQRLLKAQLQTNEIMETLKTLPFGELQRASTSLVSASEPQTIEIRISDFDDSELLKKIVVIGKWIDHTGHQREYTLTTLRSQFSIFPVKNIEETGLSTGGPGGTS